MRTIRVSDVHRQLDLIRDADDVFFGAQETELIYLDQLKGHDRMAHGRRSDPKLVLQVHIIGDPDNPDDLAKAQGAVAV